MDAEQTKLTVMHGSVEQPEIPLSGQSLTIGRGHQCDVVVSNPLVSRQHVRISASHGEYSVTDLDSHNGTFVNGERVAARRPRRLVDQDQIGIAGRVALFLFTDHPLTGEQSTLSLGAMSVPASGLTRQDKTLVLNVQERLVRVAGTRIDPPLSPQQFALLELLQTKPGMVFDRDEIAAHVWPSARAESVSDEMIDALVARVRKRIRESGSTREYLVAVRGHGFRLDRH